MVEFKLIMMNLKNKNEKQHQNLFASPNISTYIPFKLDEIYFQKKHNAKM